MQHSPFDDVDSANYVIPAIAGFECSAFEALPEVSDRDLFRDAFLLRDGRLAIVLGVVPCPAMARRLSRAFRNDASTKFDAADMIDAARRTLQAEFGEVTPGLVVVLLDNVDATLAYATAGEAGITVHRDPKRAERRMRSHGLVRSFSTHLETGDVIELRGSNGLPLLKIAAMHTRYDIEGLRRWSFDSADDVHASRIRLSIGDVLSELGASESDLLRSELIFSELVGNAYRYAGGAVEVVLDCAARLPVLHVLDSGPGWTEIPATAPDPLAVGGRGLFLVSSLAEDFGLILRAEGGTHAFAVLRLEEICPG